MVWKIRFILTNFSAFSGSKLFLMLDHTKPYVEKIHSIDAELAGHAHNLTWNCRDCVGVAFLCLLCACLLSLTTFEWTGQEHCENKMGYISLPSILNTIIVITSCYSVILKMVILHDALNLKKRQKPVSSLKNKKTGF